MEIVDSIEIEIMTSEKWDVFGMAVRGCEFFWGIICNK